MARREVKRSGTILSSETYTYDQMSRLKKVTREDNKWDQFWYYLDGEMSAAQYGIAATPTPSPSPSASPTASPTVATPTFNPVAGAYPAGDYPKTITISTATAGCNMRYTTNGTTPTTTTGTLIAASSGTASVPAGATLKAIAYRSGYINSAVRSGVYSVAPGVATPTFNPAGRNYYPATSITITISTATSGAQIRWTKDGTTPTSTHGTLISGTSGQASSGVTSDVLFKAMAFKSGLLVHINSCLD